MSKLYDSNKSIFERKLVSFFIGPYLFGFEKASDGKWEHNGRVFKNFETQKWTDSDMGGGSFFLNGWCISVMWIKGAKYV